MPVSLARLAPWRFKIGSRAMAGSEDDVVDPVVKTGTMKLRALSARAVLRWSWIQPPSRQGRQGLPTLEVPPDLMKPVVIYTGVPAPDYEFRCTCGSPGRCRVGRAPHWRWTLRPTCPIPRSWTRPRLLSG